MEFIKRNRKKLVGIGVTVIALVAVYFAVPPEVQQLLNDLLTQVLELE